MKVIKLLASLLAVVFSLSVSAEVLVQDGVPINPSTGGYSNTTGLNSLKDVNTTHANILGFDGKWRATTGVVYSDTADGLHFPSEFGTAVTTKGYSCFTLHQNISKGGADGTKNLRLQYRKLADNLNRETGTKLYFRFLMCLDANAFNELKNTGDGCKPDNDYGAGLIHETATDMRYDVHPSECPGCIWVQFKKQANGSAKLRLFVKDATSGAAQAMVLIDNPARGKTYLCVVEITVGKDNAPETFRAFAVDTADAYDPENITWVDTNTAGNACSVDVINSTDLDFIFGGNYYTSGYFKADEVMVATALSDVIYVGESISMVDHGASGVTESTATLSVDLDLSEVASADVTLKYGTDPGNLTETKSFVGLTESQTVVAELTGLSPLTAYYYQWTSTGGGKGAETGVKSFETSGGAKFGEVTVGGSPATGGSYAQVMLTEAGIAATKVECWCGQSANEMSVIKTWEDVQSGTVLVATNTAAQYGNTDYFKFVASFEYESTPYEYESSLSYVLLSGTGLWTGTAADGLWQTAGNWDLKAVPNENLAVVFEKSGFAAAEDAALAAKSLTVRKDKSNVTLDLKGTTTLQIPESITLGSDTGTQSYGCSLTMTGGVVTVGGNLNIPYNGTRGNWCSMTMVGTMMSANDLNLYSNNDSGNNNSLSLRNGAVLSVNSVSVAYSGTLSLDASIVTNSGKFVVAYNAKAGTLTLDHGSYFRQKYNSECGLGGKGTGTMTIMGGSTFDASGCSFGLGGLGDGGTYSSTLTITDGVFMASALTMPKSGSYKGTQTLNIRTDGRMSLTGNMTVGSSDSKVRDSGSSVVNVADGTLEVGGTLALGTASDRRADTLNVSGENARVMAASVSCTTNAVLKFTLPENGFANAVVETTGNLSLCSTAGWPTPITIDATACKSSAWQTLFKAGGEIKNLTDDTLAAMVTVTGTYKDRESEFKLVKDEESDKVKELKFRVRNMSSGTVIIYR